MMATVWLPASTILEIGPGYGRWTHYLKDYCDRLVIVDRAAECIEACQKRFAAEPKITGPLDVIVRIGGAGLCRTDLHIIEGQWAEKSNVTLPYILGHENAGWVQEIGSAVSNVAVGDTVIVHPLVTCG